ncbi:MAG: VWA domain-containing protein [Bdellovibrionales bacterium]|jgi:Ca-activated chloride channel family protein|nr:VWA domain-containing protein [Bdellovibrionales bacterium]
MEFNGYLYSLIGLLGLVIWSLHFFYVRKRPELILPKRASTKSNNATRGLLFLLGFIAWILITFSLSLPRKPIGFSKSSIEVNDIFFVVDVSRSMLANDFEPNRLEAAKRKIEEFVMLRPKDRIGIIIFSEKAFTLLPLSTDLKLIRQIIKEIRVGFLGSGTNIGDALGLAVGRGSQTLAKNKVVILLTDGVSNVGTMTPLQAAEMAKEANMKVYTIGVGGREDAQIPTGSAISGYYQNIPGGSIDFKTLEEISNITGAKAYLAESEESLKEVLLEIEKLERTEIEQSGKMIYEELYYNYLFIGVFLLLLVETLRLKLIREVV